MRKVLLSSTRFSVEQRVYPRPGTNPMTREVVVHPGAVVILPILDDGQIVMITNHRYIVDEELVELPAGTREPDETPMETAHRELEEETGYRAGQMQPLAEFYTSPGIMTERMHVFMASTLTMVGARLEDTEQITVRVVEAHEARRLLSTGALRDGKTMAVLGMYFAQAESRACRV